MLPSVEQPLIIVYPDIVPAMKNDTQLFISGDGDNQTFGIGRSGSMQKWISIAKTGVTRQRETQKFDLIDYPNRVGVWGVVGFYKPPRSKSRYVRNDLDNAYTTMQETLMSTALIDDKQICDIHVSERFFPVKKLALSYIFVWTIPPMVEDNPTNYIDMFISVYQKYKDKPLWEILKVQTFPVRI